MSSVRRDANTTEEDIAALIDRTEGKLYDREVRSAFRSRNCDLTSGDPGQQRLGTYNLPEERSG